MKGIVQKLLELPEMEDLSFFYTVTSISFAAVTLFISLSIIPFQKLSESISGNLYKIIIKDKKFRIPIIISVLASLAQVICLFFVQENLLWKIIYTFLLVIVFTVLLLYSYWTKTELDISTSVFPAIEKDLIKTNKLLAKTEKKLNKNSLCRINALREQMIDVFLLQENLDSYKKGPVYKDSQTIYTYKINSVYELILKDMNKIQYSSYESSVKGLEECIFKYFDFLDGHFISSDNFFFDFMEHSKIILEATLRKDSTFYYVFYMGLLKNVLKKIMSINIPKVIYFDQYINFYFGLLAKRDIKDCYGNIEGLFIILSDEHISRENIRNIGEKLKALVTVVYNLGKPHQKSLINYLVNTFCFDLFKNPQLLYERELMDIAFDLQNAIDANNLLTPTLEFDDYTTNINVKNPENDRTLATVAISFLLSQPDSETDENKNIYRISILKEIITTLVVRYEKGGIHTEGITEQLFVIFFNIVVILDKKLFKLMYHTEWTYNFTDREKSGYLECLLEILKVNQFLTHVTDLQCPKSYSELKLLAYLLKDKSVFNKTLLEVIDTNRKLFFNITINKSTFGDSLKKIIYQYMADIVSKNVRNYFSRKFEKIQKKEEEIKSTLPFVIHDFDRNNTYLTVLNLPISQQKEISDLINKELFEKDK